MSHETILPQKPLPRQPSLPRVRAGPGVVEERVKAGLRPPAITEIAIEPVDLRIYDQLLEYEEALVR